MLVPGRGRGLPAIRLALPGLLRPLAGRWPDAVPGLVALVGALLVVGTLLASAPLDMLASPTVDPSAIDPSPAAPALAGTAEPTATEPPAPTPTEASLIAAVTIVASPSATPPPATPTLAPTASPVPSPTRATVPARPGAGVPILMYHYVRVNPDPRDTIGYGLSVPPDVFAAQMAFLAERGYRVVPMRELARYVGTGKTPDEKTAVLTLDDGYRDAYTEAWPVLKQHGFTATIFMITDLIDNPRYLTRDQLRELSAAGIEIGSHSATHSDLPSLGAARLQHELIDSRAALERILGGPVLDFCYPSGRNNAIVRAAVQAAGYQTAVTVDPGLFHGKEDRFALPRVRVYGGMGLAQLARALGEPPPDAKKWAEFLNDRPQQSVPARPAGPKPSTPAAPVKR